MSAVPLFYGVFMVFLNWEVKLSELFCGVVNELVRGGRTPPILLLGESGVGKLRYCRELVRDYGCAGSYRPFRGVGGECGCRVCDGVSRGILEDVLELRGGELGVGEFKGVVQEFCSVSGVELGVRFIFLFVVL